MQYSGYREVRKAGMMEYPKDSRASFGPIPQIVIRFIMFTVVAQTGILGRVKRFSPYSGCFLMQRPQYPLFPVAVQNLFDPVPISYI